MILKRNVLLPGIVSILFMAIGIYFGNKHVNAATSQTTPSPEVQEFFTSTLIDPSNQGHPMAQWKGKTLLVNFWATWCTPCVQEMPELSALQTNSKIANAQIIGIGIDSAANIQEFLSKYKISYPLYVGGMTGSDLLRHLGDQSGGLPFSVLISPDGQIKKTYLGKLKMEDVKHDLASF